MTRVTSFAAVVLGVLAVSSMAQGQTTRPIREKVLVLPFEAVSADNSTGWIARAIRQNLVSDVGRAKLFVTSAPKDAQPAADLEAALKAGQDAGARYVIYGNYEVVQQNVRVTGHLIDVKSEQEVAPLRATGGLRDLFALEDALGDQANRALPGTKALLREAVLPQDNSDPNQNQNQQQQQQPMQQQPYAQQPAGYPVYPQQPYAPAYDPGYYYPYYPTYTYIRYPNYYYPPVITPLPVNNNYKVPPNPFGNDPAPPRNPVPDQSGGHHHQASPPVNSTPQQPAQQQFSRPGPAMPQTGQSPTGTGTGGFGGGDRLRPVDGPSR